jgi:hypothetical protein
VPPKYLEEITMSAERLELGFRTGGHAKEFGRACCDGAPAAAGGINAVARGFSKDSARDRQPAKANT